VISKNRREINRNVWKEKTDDNTVERIKIWDAIKNKRFKLGGLLRRNLGLRLLLVLVQLLLDRLCDVELAGLLPGEFGVTEMPILRRLLVNGSSKAELFDKHAGSEIEIVIYDFQELGFGQQ